MRVLLCLLTLGLCGLPSAAFADRWAAEPNTTQAWVKTDAEAYLRAAPDLLSEQVSTVRAGTVLRILEDQSGEWTHVVEPRSALEAYVHSSLLVPADPPSAFVYMAPPAVDQELSTTAIATEDLPLYFYPNPNPRARALTLEASERQTIVGTVIGDDGASWYETADGYFLPPVGLFLSDAPRDYFGRWLDVTLNGAKVVAYEGGVPVRTFLAIKGVAKYPTPLGAWSIVRRVANETMDSNTIGIPRNSPGGYFLKNVLYTQYFRDTGESLHYNWWSSAWGAPGSHGCLGLSLGDSKWLWDWANVGTPVLIHP